MKKESGMEDSRRTGRVLKSQKLEENYKQDSYISKMVLGKQGNKCTLVKGKKLMKRQNT